MRLFFIYFSYPDSLSRRERLVRRSVKNPTAKNRVGYGNEDRSWYPTLFGWEIEKRLAYFTTSYALSSAMRGSEFWVPSLGLKRETRNLKLETVVCYRHMASEMPNLQVPRFLQKYR
jgi:hypothetical protein